jgi:hypothetical protein
MFLVLDSELQLQSLQRTSCVIRYDQNPLFLTTAIHLFYLKKYNLSVLGAISCLVAEQVPPLRFLNIGGNSIGDDGAAIVGAGLIAAAGLRLLMLRFLGLDNNSMYAQQHHRNASFIVVNFPFLQIIKGF